MKKNNMKEHNILLTIDELNHIHAAVHNMAKDYHDWAIDDPDDKDLFDDYIGSYREMLCIEQKIESAIEQAKRNLI